MERLGDGRRRGVGVGKTYIKDGQLEQFLMAELNISRRSVIIASNPNEENNYGIVMGYLQSLIQLTSKMQQML